LVGNPESKVIQALGNPSSVWKYENIPGEKLTTTYNYYPFSWYPFSKFQVHCREGVVQNTEQFDD